MEESTFTCAIPRHPHTSGFYTWGDRAKTHVTIQHQLNQILQMSENVGEKIQINISKKWMICNKMPTVKVSETSLNVG